MAQRSMKSSRVVTDGNILTLSTWTVDPKVADLDTVNFTSFIEADNASYDEGISGILSADIRFGGDWDASANFFDDPPGLYPRDDLPDTQFYESIVDNVNWDFPYIRLRGASNGGDVNGKVAFSVNGMNQGQFSLPTGSV